MTYDSDALANDNKLLKEAHNAGLIDKESRDSYNKVSPDKRAEVRKAVLDSIGWLAADKCFEEQVASSGYLNVILEAIENEDTENHSDKKALDSFLSQNNFEISPRSIALFITKTRKTLKIPVARAVAKSIKDIKAVPTCYANAIRNAILQSRGGILTDNYFEQRAYFAGFKDVIFAEMKQNGIFENYSEFLQENQIDHSALGIGKYFTGTEPGLAFRPNLKTALADAIEACGCKEYADIVRQSDFYAISS